MSEIEELKARIDQLENAVRAIALGQTIGSDERGRIVALPYSTAWPQGQTASAALQWGYPNHPGVAGPCQFADGSKWDGFKWTLPPRGAQTQ